LGVFAAVHKKQAWVQGYNFAQSHSDPTFADGYVDGTPVILKFMGETNCNPFQNYGC